MSGIVRSDIRSSIGAASGTATGVPLTLALTLTQQSGNCRALSGYAVYIWHCDKDGLYSLYTLPTENYLRGIQATDENGNVTFTTVFPGCYPGRWPHIHLEVYASLGDANDAKKKLATSQLALTEASCKDAYATAGYGVSVANLGRVTINTDSVFRDGATLETPVVTGSATSGYAASLAIAIS